MTTQTDTTTGHATPAQLAQRIADVCYAIATHEGPMAHHEGGVYRYAHASLAAAVTEVYGPELTESILEILVDCGESLEYCAGVARRKLADEQEARDDDDRETFLHALAVKLALTFGAVGGLADHIIKYDVTNTLSLPTRRSVPRWRLVLGVDVPRISVLSNVPSVTS